MTIADEPTASNSGGGRTALQDVALTDVVGGRIGSASIHGATIYKSAAADAGWPKVACTGERSMRGKLL